MNEKKKENPSTRLAYRQACRVFSYSVIGAAAGKMGLECIRKQTG
jgi:sulfite exporter TauE/SafE